jgi:hypothetical protein
VNSIWVSPENSPLSKKAAILAAQAVMVDGVQSQTKPNIAMTEREQEVFEFQEHGRRIVTADFSGGAPEQRRWITLHPGGGEQAGDLGEAGGML